MTLLEGGTVTRRLLTALGVGVAGVALLLGGAAGPTAQAHPVPPDSSTSASPTTMTRASMTGTDGAAYYGSASVDLRVARLTTDRFHSLAAAGRAGYTVEFKDRLGFTCISDLPGRGHHSLGAMGVHLLNPAYVGSTDPAHPAAVLYRPGRHGAMTLVGLEYLVVEPQQPQPPAAFGQHFMFTPAGDPSVNRFMPDAFYSLHVWTWKRNPSGRFAMWNPRVRCPSGQGR
jgi:hypothetical protein